MKEWIRCSSYNNVIALCYLILVSPILHEFQGNKVIFSLLSLVNDSYITGQERSESNLRCPRYLCIDSIQ